MPLHSVDSYWMGVLVGSRKQQSQRTDDFQLLCYPQCLSSLLKCLTALPSQIEDPWFGEWVPLLLAIVIKAVKETQLMDDVIVDFP